MNLVTHENLRALWLLYVAFSATAYAEKGQIQTDYDGHELVSIKCYRIDEESSQARADIAKDLDEQAQARSADEMGPVIYFKPDIQVGPWCYYMLGGRAETWRFDQPLKSIKEPYR